MKRANSGNFLENTGVINPTGEGFPLWCSFASVQNVPHTVHVDLDNHLINTYTDVTIQSGVLFRLVNVLIPIGTSAGKHTLKVTILPENESAELDVFVCSQDGSGCEPRIGLVINPHTATVQSYFGVTKLQLPIYQELEGDGFPIAPTNDTGPVANATIWVDRSCANAESNCVETRTRLGMAQVYSDGSGIPMGSFQFGNPLHGINLTASDLGPNSPHKLQAYVNGHVGEILFTG